MLKHHLFRDATTSKPSHFRKIWTLYSTLTLIISQGCTRALQLPEYSSPPLTKDVKAKSSSASCHPCVHYGVGVLYPFRPSELFTRQCARSNFFFWLVLFITRPLYFYTQRAVFLLAYIEPNRHEAPTFSSSYPFSPWVLGLASGKK